MRFKDKTPNVGDRRVVKTFLLLPRKIDRDIRWLEMATIEQRYVYKWKESGTCWTDDHFINK